MREVEIEKGYRPGALGRVVELHATYYHARWGFGPFFETKVARELAEFLQRYEDSRDGFWTFSSEGRVEGSITIDGLHASTDGAHLRWFIVSDAVRGRGLGARLVRSAVEFCRARRYSKVFLWTFEGLDVARKLYEGAGFKLVEERRGSQWGAPVNEQRFELSLP